MNFYLGDKVTFTESLLKQSGYGVDYENLTDKQRKALENDGCINLIRYKYREHNEKQGFVCGKRNIVTAVLLEEFKEPDGKWHLAQTHEKQETIYLVACDMRGLYRVRAEDLEKAKEVTE